MSVRRRLLGAAAVLAIAAAAAGCVPEPSGSPSAAASATPRPRASASPTPTSSQEPAAAIVEDMTTAQQAASIVMGHIPGTDAAALHAYMSQGLGGFILMGANIPETEAELQGLTAALAVDPELPPLIAVDQEGGIVSRLHGDAFAASTTLKSLPPAETTAAFTARAELVARAGITVNFGTVADVTADPGSFIYGRALGVDPASAAERVAAATAAQEPFVASTLKHFPGHGAAAGDSHHVIPSTPRSLDEWRQTDAVPFAAGIEAGARVLMFGHLAYTAVDPAPASLSPAWYRIARDDLGFDGVAVTDDLGMLQSSGDPAYADPAAVAVMAVAAGADLMLMIAGSTPDTAGQIVAGLVAAVESGALPEERLEEAALRVMRLRLELR